MSPDLILQLQYALLFVGLFFGGDTAVLAGVYLASIGVMHLRTVILLSIIAFILADIVWYVLGRYLTYEKLKTLPIICRRKSRVDRLEAFMEKHALRTLFYSKFLYGSRMIVQILCGTHAMRLRDYIGINLLGHVMIIVGSVALGAVVHVNLYALRHTVHGIELVFLAAALLLVFVHLFFQRFVRKWLK